MYRHFLTIIQCNILYDYEGVLGYAACQINKV